LPLASITGCTKNHDDTTAKTFVLVHGAWQAPFVWDAVKKQLEDKGQKVIVVELPAHGSDSTSPVLVSIDAYRDKVIASIKDVKGRIILVGHSLGGVVVTSVAKKIPGSDRNADFYRRLYTGKWPVIAGVGITG
jgi:pimeloyl-ACP methyl ester carboxylesterase